MKHIIEHCGNFSEHVLEGLIGYGREVDKGRGKMNAGTKLPDGDGYATKESDICLGGFIHRLAAPRVAAKGRAYESLDVLEKERLATEIAREHIIRFGTSSHEHYGHWTKRARAFARHQGIALPFQNSQETDHQYFRRVRQWIKTRKEKWPELFPAAGIHLVFSPDPHIWPSLRAAGVDERIFLRSVISRTIKEFSDWRRKELGIGHSLGWVAGTHVKANGAHRHPHLHLVVLKRDEAGRDVDLSVTSLKGHQEKHGPDPLAELKRLFEKSIERELGRFVNQETIVALEKPQETKTPQTFVQYRTQTPSPFRHHLRRLARGLQTVFRVMKTPSRGSFPMVAPTQAGTALRFLGLARTGGFRQGYSSLFDPAVTLASLLHGVRASHPTPPTLER